MDRPMKFLNLLHKLHREHNNDSTMNQRSEICEWDMSIEALPRN
jgi:hypothetical protein